MIKYTNAIITLIAHCVLYAQGTVESGSAIA